MTYRHEWKHEINTSDMITLRQRLRAVAQSSERRATEYLEKQISRLVVKSKTVRKGSIELNMEIRMKDDNTGFINALADMDGVNNTVLVSYNGDYMG